MKKILLLTLSFIFLLVGTYVGYRTYSKPPEIKTHSVQLPYGEPFSLNQIKTSKDVVSKKILTGSVDNHQLGTQSIKVKVTNQRNYSAVGRVNVSVFDNVPPVIETPREIITEAKTKFDIKTAITARDNVDGDMKGKLSISPYSTDRISIQDVSIIAMDSSKNQTKVTVKLKVVDRTKPVLSVHDVTLTQGQTFTATSGISATDTVDGNLTNKVTISGKANTNQLGTYPVTYSVKDSSNNESAKTIKVIVVARRASAPSAVLSKTVPSTTSTVTARRYAPMTLYFNGKAVPYRNGGTGSGQRIINSGRVASTWGGATVFSGTDGLNTHFIGHNPGVFTGIQNARSFVITDVKGNAFTYKVTRVYQVNDYAVGIQDKIDYWNRITGTSGGERVTFQTCYNNSINWIVEASLI